MHPGSFAVTSSLRGAAVLLLSLAWGLKAQAPAASSEPSPPNIQSAWDKLIQDTIPKAVADPALTVAQTVVKKNAASNFLNHFYFETRTDYWRTDTSFTGLPTVTGVIDAPFTGVFNPNGIPYQAAFQPSSNRIYEFVDWGTRGWLSDRVNTHFAYRYQQDLTPVDLAAPAAGPIETFGSNRRIELVNASVEINGKPGDGFFTNGSVSLGRQYVYGAETAALDGASFTKSWRNVTFNVFGGRRFTYFGDPDQRAIGGGSVLVRIDPSTSLSFESLVYIRGTHRVSFRRRMGDWSLNSYVRAVGGAPVDFSTQVMYQPRAGRSSLRVSFFQKISDLDYFYDFTTTARDQDPYNKLLRLYLGPLNPYAQFVVEGRHTLGSRLRVGGTVWVRRLTDQNPSAFLTSFEDYRISAQWFPPRKIELDLEYHQRNSARLPPDPNTQFDDVSTSGETSVKDLTAQVRRSFAEGRLSLTGGLYYRRISTQDRFFYIDGTHQSGWTGGAWWKLDSRTRVFFDYALDNDFFVFRPSIANARILRVGVGWKY